MIRPHLPLMLAAWLALALLPAATRALAPRVAQDTAPTPLTELEVARVGELAITWDEYHRYVGTVYDRLDEGEEALQQLLLDVIVGARAASLGLPDGDALVQAERDALLRRGLAAGADPEALAARLAEPALQPSLRLLATQKAVLRHERGLPDDAPVDDAELAAWTEQALLEADVVRLPLEDELAARFEHGVISRIELGRRVEPLLSPSDRSGVLTELLGILLVHRKAAQLGVTYDPQVAADELADRERYVLERMGDQGVSYDAVLERIDRRSREELVASPAFTAQVVLRQLVASSWDEQRARQWWQGEHARYAKRFGPDHVWEDVSHTVWREVRQRTYQQLFADGTIQRRF